MPSSARPHSLTNSPIGADAWAVLLVALLLRLPQLDHPALFDEYYHALASRALLEGGSLAGDAFTYQRSFVFTWIVSACTWLFGDSFVAMRLLSLMSGAALVMASYLAVRALAGRVAGIAAACLLGLDPNAIYLSQLARPYATHALVFFVSSVALLRSIETDDGAARLRWLVAAIAGFALAHHLNFMTSIGLAAIAASLILTQGPQLWRHLASNHHLGVAALAVAVLVAAAGWLLIDRGSWALGLYRSAPTFLLADRSNATYYARYLGGHLPVLFALLPIAWLGALPRHRTWVLRCTVFLAAALVMHSLAGRKQPRYVFYLMPYVYAILALGAAAAWTPLQQWVSRGIAALSPRRGGRMSGALPIVASAGIAGIALLANPAYQNTGSMLLAKRGEWPGARFHAATSDWAAAEPRLRTLTQDTCTLIASSGVKALYHLGRLDYDLSVTVREETYANAEFAPDYRHKRPVISEPKSILRVAAQHPSGLVVVDEVHWRRAGFVSDAAADEIERFEPIPLPPEWRLLAFRWGNPERRPCEADEPASS
jgi:hypothetical protein